MSDSMQNNPEDSMPDEIKIEKLLSEFNPQPTKRFTAMMSSAPWQKQENTRSFNET
jgi:hypothetical protein